MPSSRFAALIAVPTGSVNGPELLPGFVTGEARHAAEAVRYRTLDRKPTGWVMRPSSPIPSRERRSRNGTKAR